MTVTAETVLTFGKFRGKTVEQIPMHYRSWAMEQSGASGQLRELANHWRRELSEAVRGSASGSVRRGAGSSGRGASALSRRRGFSASANKRQRREAPPPAPGSLLLIKSIPMDLLERALVVAAELHSMPTGTTDPSAFNGHPWCSCQCSTEHMMAHCIGGTGRAASSSQGRHAHVTTFRADDPTNLPWVGQRVLQLVSEGEVHEDNGFAEGEVQHPTIPVREIKASYLICLTPEDWARVPGVMADQEDEEKESDGARSESEGAQEGGGGNVKGLTVRQCIDAVTEAVAAGGGAASVARSQDTAQGLGRTE